MFINLPRLSISNSTTLISLSVHPPLAVGGSSCDNCILSPISNGRADIGTEKFILFKPACNLDNHFLPV